MLRRAYTRAPLTLFLLCLLSCFLIGKLFWSYAEKNAAAQFNCSSATILPADLSDGVLGQAYSQQLILPANTFRAAIQFGSLPPGLTMNAAGLIQGTPTTSGSFSFTVKAISFASTCLGSRAFVVVVTEPAKTIPPTPAPKIPNPLNAACALTNMIPDSLSAMEVGLPANVSFNAAGGVRPYRFSVESGNIPIGLSLDSSTGLLSGTPMEPGSFTFTIKITDSILCTLTRTYSLVVNCPPRIIDTQFLTNPEIGRDYRGNFSISGFPYEISLESGSLPPGLSLDSRGQFSGIPTTLGSFTFTIKLSSYTSLCFLLRTHTLTVVCPPFIVNTESLPNAQIGRPYLGGGISVSGFPYTVSVENGNVPTGLTLNSLGQLTGTPTMLGSFTFTVRVTGAGPPCYVLRTYTQIVECPPMALSPDTLPTAQIGRPYSEEFFGSGGDLPYSFNLESGTLPAGLSFNPATRRLSGTPTELGSWTFSIKLTASYGCSVTRTYWLNVMCSSPMTISPSSLPGAEIGRPYAETFRGSGGTLPYSFTLAGGALPPGLNLDSTTGRLSGTPTALGSATFTIKIASPDLCYVTRSYTLNVVCASVMLNPSSVPAAVINQLYFQTLTASGGTAPHSFSLSGGGLPSGINLSSNGQLSGKPSVLGSFTFAVSAQDTNGCAQTQTYALSVNCPAAGCGSGALTVSPNPVLVCDGSGLGVVTLYWQTMNATNVQVRVNSPSGPLFASGASGSQATGKWVTNGMKFYLVNADTSTTLDQVTVSHSNTSCNSFLGLSRNPIQVCDGSGIGVAHLIWQAPADITQTEIRLHGPRGEVFHRGGSSGTVRTGKWVTNGMRFFLVNAVNNEPLASQVAMITNSGCQSFTSAVAQSSAFQLVEHTLTECENGATDQLLGIAHFAWESPAERRLELHLGAPDGPLVDEVAMQQAFTTGLWVSDGMTFYLVDVTDAEPVVIGETLIQRQPGSCARPSPQ